VVDAKVALQGLVEAKDTARAEVEEVLRTAGREVDEAAKGNVETIHLGGMQATSDRQLSHMEQVEGLDVTAGDAEGALDVQWEPEPGAKVYEVQISTDTATPPGNWVHKLSSPKSRCQLTGLTSGSKVWVRVKAVGPNDEGPWSDVAWKTVP
jgi:hypothetical protein